ncbi:MAG: hypothetical protein WD691_00300 [Acidimicrobiales bacterium]
MRRIAATLVAALTAAGCSGGGVASLAEQARAAATTQPPAATTTTTALIRTGEPLEIREQGVSSFPDPFDRGATLGGYGVVLHNPNPDVIAAGVRVVTRVLNSLGEELVVDSTLLNGVMPGQSMALGRTLIEPIEDPTQLDVSVEVSAWLEPFSTTGNLEATDIITEPEANGGAVTRFTVRSTWPESEEGVDVTAIYRALDGRILGAESTTLPLVPPAGEVLGQIRLLSPIPELASTEVFVGRGLAAQTTG